MATFFPPSPGTSKAEAPVYVRLVVCVPTKLSGADALSKAKW
jgi:hypothetical protein